MQDLVVEVQAKIIVICCYIVMYSDSCADECLHGISGGWVDGSSAHELAPA